MPSASKTKANNVCGIEYALGVLGKKWTLLIVRSLSKQKRRFGELQRELGDINTKTLTQRLRELEKHSIIKRHSYPEIPPKVEYELTKKGKSLIPILMQVKNWGKNTIRLKNN